MSIATNEPTRTIVPAPSSLVAGVGAFQLTADTRIVAGAPAAAAVGELLAATLRPGTGFALPIVAEETPAAVTLALEPTATALGAEGYELAVTPDGVTIRGATAAGLFYGTQTLRQLLPPAVDSATAQPGPWAVAATRITDTPRYPWRGAMLDVARHFFSAKDVIRYLDEIALYKINVLHLHLSDDQGWRIAIDSRPLLTEVGGRTAVGGGSGGYYSKQDYKNIVDHAAARFITIVPEIDMPGHTNAALASYAELNCDGKAREPFTGIDVGFSSVCVDSEATYAFLDEVIGELAAMTPGPYLHIGGDEVETLTPAQYSAFITRVQSIVTKHGKTLVGWEEAVHGTLAAGSILQHWNTNGGYAGPLKTATDNGMRVILSPADRTYLDMKYDDEYPLGLEWAGRVSLERAYDWDPAEVIPGAKAGGILGVEGALWSETLSTMADVESMAFPRLAAVAETGWSAPARDWPAFRVRIAAQARRWDVMGLAYHRAPGVEWPANP